MLTAETILGVFVAGVILVANKLDKLERKAKRAEAEAEALAEGYEIYFGDKWYR